MTPTAIPQAEAPPAPWKHIPSLDGVRAVAALMVLVFHYYGSLPGDDHWIRLCVAATVPGRTGVDLFFVLSGFLITGILLAMKGTPHAWRNFYMRRILRIFPLYYGVLALLAMIGLLAYGLGRQVLEGWWYWAYLQNFLWVFAPDKVAAGFPDHLAPRHFWSLAIEEHFYLVWPALVLTLPKNRLLPALAVLLGGTVLARFLFLQAGYVHSANITFCYLDGLCLGSAIAVVWCRPAARAMLRRWALWLLPPTLVLLAWIFAAPTLRREGLVQVPKYFLIALAYAGLLVLVLEASPTSLLARSLSSRPLRSIGKYSYAFYVVHPYAILCVTQLLLLLPTQLRGVASFAGILPATLLTYAFAWASWHLYEKHFLALKRHFEYAPRPMTAAT